MANLSNIPLNGIFNKGFVKDDNNINTSQEYGSISLNTRNGIGTIKNRRGYWLLQNLGSISGAFIKSLTSLKGKLLAEYNGKLYQSNDDLALYEDKGNINTGDGTLTQGSTIKTIGDIAIIANGGNMQYFDGKDNTLKTITNPYTNIGDVWETEKDDVNDYYGKWTSIAVNDNSTIIIGVQDNGYIYKSTNGGETFIQKGSIAGYKGVAMSSTGQYIYAVAYSETLSKSGIYKSSDYGETWTKELEDNGTFFFSVACSTNGEYVFVSGGDEDTKIGRVYKSSDYGDTFSISIHTHPFLKISCSGDGSKVIVGSKNDKLFYSKNNGTTFSEKLDNGYYYSVYIDRNGDTILFNNGNILYKTDDEFMTYNEVSNSDLYSTVKRQFSDIKGSTTKGYILASIYGGVVLVSFDNGNTFSQLLTESDKYTSVAINEECSSTNGIFLTCSLGGYIKRSKNTVKFNPNLIEIYGRRLYLAGLSDKKSTLIVSQGYIVDERELVNFGPDAIRIPVVLQREGDIIGMKHTSQNMFLFETTGVSVLTGYYNTLTPTFDYIDRNSILQNNKCIVSADNLVFFLTKDKKIKTIGYVSGITNAQIGELSNQPGSSIQKYLDETLDDNQDMAFGYFYDPDKTVKFHVRSKGAASNDLVIVYDMVNKTFHIDDNKRFSCSTELNGKYYVGSYLIGNIYQDEVGNTDNGEGITCIRETKTFDFGDSTIRKIMRELRLGGMVNLDTKITMELYANNELVHSKIVNDRVVSNSIAGIKIANELYQFNKSMTKGDIHATGYTYKIRFVIEGNTNSIGFVLSSLSTSIKGTSNGNRNELFET